MVAGLRGVRFDWFFAGLAVNEMGTECAAVTSALMRDKANDREKACECCVALVLVLAHARTWTSAIQCANGKNYLHDINRVILIDMLRFNPVYLAYFLMAYRSAGSSNLFV